MSTPRQRILVCAVTIVSFACASRAAAQGQTTGRAQPGPLQPNRVAAVFPDGTLGPWHDINEGEPLPGMPLDAVWDSLERDPQRYNRLTNEPQEYFDVPPGSGKYCVGWRSSDRLFWCDPKQPGCQPLPNCISATGGQVAKRSPDRVLVASFLWGALRTGRPVQVEIRVFDSYDGGACAKPGSNLLGGFVADFGAPQSGWNATTIDLERFGIDFDAPRTGRIGIQVIMWEDRAGVRHSDQAWPLLWVTKSERSDYMGRADKFGFSSAHGAGDCKMESAACVQGESVCPDGERPVGPAVVLLGAGEYGNCQYIARKVKHKRGCTACPNQGEPITTQQSCGRDTDCPKKAKFKRLECLGGGPGHCYAKGPRLGCSNR